MSIANARPCTESDCDGALDDDGYCDTCGVAAAMPPPAAASPPAATSPPAAVPPPAQNGPPPPAPPAGRQNTGTLATGPGNGNGNGRSLPSGTGSGPVSGPMGGPGSGPVSGSARGSGSARRGRIGAGMVDVPPVPAVDPASALLTNPQVAEHKRFCRVCEEPVGRSKGDKPGRVEGFCPRDGTPFSFLPTLTAGTIVADQYLVQGCLAYGGLGWIYLALDRNVDNRWVVLKGLLDSGDQAAQAASAAERRFLAEVNHPNIVTIHNFVRHPGADGKPIGYIVMEYVGGSSLRTLVEQAGSEGRIGALPLAQVIAYGLEILPALEHLHAQGLAYCDLKPDNVIQLERRLKLIDMGAVVPYRDNGYDLYGTPGYQPPELRTHGASPAGDIYTVGRTMAVLALGMIPLRRGGPVPLPEPGTNEILARHESFDRLLRRATHEDPLRRFASADEMADQLAGVLREVLAAEDGKPRPGRSVLFGAPRAVFAAGLRSTPSGPGRPDPVAVAQTLPLPLVDTDDPAASMLATATSAAPDELFRLSQGHRRRPSPELRLRVVRAHLEAGDTDAARAELDSLEIDRPADWRIAWFRGCTALVAGRPGDAAGSFDFVLSMLPGEAAPKLALAAATEAAGDDATAGRYYLQVGRPDPDIADAAFGRARVALRTGDPGAALAALDTVPPTSSQYVTAQTVAVRAVVGDEDNWSGADEHALRSAAARLERLDLTGSGAHELRAGVFEAALRVVPHAVHGPSGPPLLGCAWSAEGVRTALESELRAAARLTPDDERRWTLVDRANASRPRSWT